MRKRDRGFTLMKFTECGPINCACAECGADMAPLQSSPGRYPAPNRRNCNACRSRKNGNRVGKYRTPKVTA